MAEAYPSTARSRVNLITSDIITSDIFISDIFTSDIFYLWHYYLWHFYLWHYLWHFNLWHYLWHFYLWLISQLGRGCRSWGGGVKTWTWLKPLGAHKIHPVTIYLTENFYICIPCCNIAHLGYLAFRRAYAPGASLLHWFVSVKLVRLA